MELVFILVEPAVPENVGAAARALKTMGHRQLRIVASEAHRQKAAHILAHGSTDLLEQAQHHADLASALADLDLVIATSAKRRLGMELPLEPPALRRLLQSQQESVQRVGIVFGREATGLHNDELALCHLHTAIPLAEPFPSLNLGQAVMLYAYELRHCTTSLAVEATAESAPERALAALRDRVEVWLPSIGVEPGSRVSRWARERLHWLTAKDIGYCHRLLDLLQRKP